MPRRTITKTTRKRAKRPIADPHPNYPAWSTAKYRTFIRSAMRKAWMKWPPRFEALRAVRRDYCGPNKRQKFEFQCAHCQHWFMQKEVSVDHIQPWGYIWNASLLDAWDRLLVAVHQLQVLCKTCHDRKTEREAAMR